MTQQHYANSLIQATTSLDEAVMHGWDELIGTFDLYLSSSWLRVEEQIAALSPTYLIGGYEGKPTIGLTCHALGSETPAWPFARIDAFLLRLLKGRGNVTDDTQHVLSRTLPTILCGGRRPGHTRLLLAPELDETTQRQEVQQIINEAEVFGFDHGAASLSFLFVDESDQVVRDMLLENGFAEFKSAIPSRMAVPTNFEDYLRRFGKRRRWSIQAEYKSLQEAGITYEVLPLTEALIEDILPLEQALNEKYGTLFSATEAARLHHAVAEVLGERVQVLTAQQGGKIRGFIVLVRQGNTLFGRQAGFDYEFQGQKHLPLYFGLAFYATIEHAAQVGATYIEYGVGSEQAKALRGCEQRQQYGYIKVFDSSDHKRVSESIQVLTL